MSWKYSQAADIRSAQAALASSLRATARASKMAARRGVGYGNADPSRNFGNLGMGMFKGNERSFLKRIPYGTQGGRSRVLPVVFPQETKYFDCGFNAVVTWAGTDWSASELPCDNYINSSGTAAAYTDSCLIPTAIGSGYGQVNGNRYRLKKIRVRGQIDPGFASDQADVLGTTTVRMLLVMDTMPNGAQAQGEDVLQDFGATGENIFAFQRVSAQSGRFRVLKDQVFEADVSAAGTDGASTNSIGFKDPNFSFTYTPKTPITVNVRAGNATPTIAGTVDCNIFVLVGAVRSGAAVGVTVYGCSRAYYCE